MFYFFELQEYLFLLGQQSYSSLPCITVTSVHILIVMYHSEEKKSGGGPILMSDIWFWELSPKLSNCVVLSKLLNFFMTHWLNACEFEQTSRDGEGQGSLACCSPWGSERVGHDLANERQQQFSNLLEKGRKKKRKITIISLVLRMT